MKSMGGEGRRAFVLAAVLSAVAVSAPAPALAAPPDRDGAVALWKRITDNLPVQSGWTGSTVTCDIGRESAQSIDATLTTVNALREFAGLAPVAFDPAKNRQALAAATMMSAAGRLEHDPGPDWPCYTEEGDAGAGNSNLFLGLTGPAAMVGYVDDSGVGSLGHRRWVLSPYASTFGTGSTDRTNALHVTPGDSPPQKGPSPEVLAWPPAGFVPWNLVFADWSAQFELPGTIDLTNARVAVRVDGAERRVAGVRSLPESYGQGGPLLTWRVGTTPADRQGDRAVQVSIAGVTVDGVERPFSYEVHAVDLQPPVITLARAVFRGRLRPGRAITVQTIVRHAPTVRYQWLRGERPIPGATGRTYRVRRGDRGRRIRCRVTASNESGVSVTRHTASVRVPRR